MTIAGIDFKCMRSFSVCVVEHFRGVKVFASLVYTVVLRGFTFNELQGNIPLAAGRGTNQTNWENLELMNAASQPCCTHEW